MRGSSKCNWNSLMWKSAGEGRVWRVCGLCYHISYDVTVLYQSTNQNGIKMLKAQPPTFLPLWKNAAPRICSPGKEAVPRQSQSFRMWSLKLQSCTVPAVSATSSLSPGRSQPNAVTPALFEITLKHAVMLRNHSQCIIIIK